MYTFDREIPKIEHNWIFIFLGISYLNSLLPYVLACSMEIRETFKTFSLAIKDKFTSKDYLNEIFNLLLFSSDTNINFKLYMFFIALMYISLALKFLCSHNQSHKRVKNNFELLTVKNPEKPNVNCRKIKKIEPDKIQEKS